MNTRLLKVGKMLKEKKADVFWLPNRERSGQPGTRYLAGFSGSDSHLLVTKGKAYLLTDGRYLAAAKKEARGCTVVDVAEQSLVGLFNKILPTERDVNILIDGSVTSFSVVEKMKQGIGYRVEGIEKKKESGSTKPYPLHPGPFSANIINADGALKEFRRVKTAEEIAFLKKAADISCRAFEKFLPFVTAGVTERSLARKLTDLLADCGAEAVAFDPIIASGGNGAFPHARPTDKKLRRGELVVIDFGATYRGYCADMTRTIAIGSISPRLQEMYEAVRDAQRAGCKVARAGVPARAVDTACREVLKRHGFEKYFTHSTGHGIGMEVHELPNIGSKTSRPLEARETITCEPGVYIEDLGGVRIEDSLVLTRSGVLNLTARVEKKLIVL